jgi:hypothetical protein
MQAHTSAGWFSHLAGLSWSVCTPKFSCCCTESYTLNHAGCVITTSRVFSFLFLYLIVTVFWFDSLSWGIYWARLWGPQLVWARPLSVLGLCFGGMVASVLLLGTAGRQSSVLFSCTAPKKLAQHFRFHASDWSSIHVHASDWSYTQVSCNRLLGLTKQQSPFPEVIDAWFYSNRHQPLVTLRVIPLGVSTKFGHPHAQSAPTSYKTTLPFNKKLKQGHKNKTQNTL